MRTFVVASVFCATAAIGGIASAERPHAEQAPKPERVQSYVERSRPSDDSVSVRFERPDVVRETPSRETIRPVESAAKPAAITAKQNLGRPGDDDASASRSPATTSENATRATHTSSATMPAKIAAIKDAARPGDDSSDASHAPAAAASTSSSDAPYQLQQARARSIQRAIGAIQKAVLRFLGPEAEDAGGGGADGTEVN